MLKSQLFLSLTFTLSLSLSLIAPDCPAYASLLDSSVTIDFSEEAYQGEWFCQYDTEATEPTLCYCHRMTWLINDDRSTFREPIDTTVDSIGFFPIYLEGHLSADKSLQWLRTEGAPLVGEIPNGVIAVRTKDQLPSALNNYTYQAVLVYSCGVDYLLQSVFQSVQVLILRGYWESKGGTSRSSRETRTRTKQS